MRAIDLRLWCFIALAVFVLTACATAPVVPPEPVVKTVTVSVPTPVSCVQALPPEPSWPATAEALNALTPDFNGAWRGAALTIGDDELAHAYAEQLRAILQACVTAK